MSRYTPDDLARLGEHAKRQILNVQFGIDEQQRQRDLLAEPKPSKYRNRKTEVDGIVFDSKAEADRWLELKLLHRAGRISCLIRQPELMICINGHKIASYFADFTYVDVDGKVVYEDIKSKPTKTSVYRLKKKIVECLYNIKIVEVMT